MICSKDCMQLILSKVPEFEPAWREHLDFWGQDEAGLSNDLAEFSSFLVENISSIAFDKKEEIFAFVETCVIEGDEALKDAIATCFLENLLNAASGQKIAANSFVGFLGKESKAFCKAWDKFTGVKTEGL